MEKTTKNENNQALPAVKSSGCIPEVRKYLPCSIKIGGVDYKVIVADILRGEGRAEIAYLQVSDAKIKIAENIEIQIAQQALLHEAVEAINAINDLNLNHQQISTIAESFFQILRDNDLGIKPRK